jgi:predicted AAA+ superfamily ATPase
LLRRRLEQFPAVALLGPRQVGKTTLALQLAATTPSLYLDLEASADLGLCPTFSSGRVKKCLF